MNGRIYTCHLTPTLESFLILHIAIPPASLFGRWTDDYVLIVPHRNASESLRNISLHSYSSSILSWYTLR